MADTGTQNQLNAGLRYAGTAAGTLFGVLGAMSLITPEQAHDLVMQVQVLNQSILTAYGALTKMGLILGPAAAIIAGYFGVKSASVQALGAKLLNMVKQEPPAPTVIGGLESIQVAPTVTVAEAQKTIAAASSATEVLAAVVAAAPAAVASKG
jgi:hypothetical protein